MGMTDNFTLNNEDSKKEGLKSITETVFDLFCKNKILTYPEICESVDVKNSNTLRRRVYDILSVLRALEHITKEKKNYVLIKQKLEDEIQEDIAKKESKIKDLIENKRLIKYIVKRNKNRVNSEEEKLRLPFIIIACEYESNIRCETDEDRSYYEFKSNQPIKLLYDMNVIRDIENTNKQEMG